MFKIKNRNSRKKVWNKLKVNNEDSRATTLTSFLSLLFNFELTSHLFLKVSMDDLKYAFFGYTKKVAYTKYNHKLNYINLEMW